MDTSAVRGMSLWRSADCDPKPKSAFRSSTVQNCSTFIKAADVQEAAWLVARAHRSKVLGASWPRPLSKNYIMCCHAPTQNKWNFCTATVWKTTQIVCDIEIDMEQPAGGQHIYPTGMGFHRKIMCLSNLLRTVVVRSECKEAQFNMTLTFLAGESLKQSHRFISPMAVWLLYPIVSQLNWKRCSMQVQQ